MGELRRLRRGPRIRLTAPLAVAALIAAAYASEPAAAFASVRDLHRALVRGGAACEESRFRPGLIPRGDVLLCTSTGPGSDGTSYLLAVWHGPRPAAFGPGDTRVDGVNWAVLLSHANDTQAARVVAAVGGRYHPPA